MTVDERKQGGMTGATGNLTPDEPDDEFVPAETREISDPAAAGRLTASAHDRADARGAERGGEPGRLADLEATDPPPLEPGTRLGGDERHDPEDEHL
jgi:hypothetical protein